MLTKSSVAEVAKKPLYRVTCGDIGTKAEEVEKVGLVTPQITNESTLIVDGRSPQYLETVLTLAKEWGCGKQSV